MLELLEFVWTPQFLHGFPHTIFKSCFGESWIVGRYLLATPDYFQPMFVFLVHSRYLAHLNNSNTDSDKFHSIIYRQSDLDASSITGATCGSTHDDVQSGMLRLQQRSMRGRGLEGDHILMKRQMFDPRRTRCPLSVRLDYKLFRELANNGENPMAVVLYIIQIVRKRAIRHHLLPDNWREGRGGEGG